MENGSENVRGTRGGGGSLPSGTMLDHYRLERCLGVGGMGEVYYAVHEVLQTPCAVKIIRPEIAKGSPEVAARLIREARMACRIQHSNIVGVLDASSTSDLGCPYIVMEYVDGVSAEKYLGSGPMSEEDVIAIALGVTEALVAAAKYKIVHRDIKPANIMIDSRGQVKLADLGIAKSDASIAGGTLTQENALLGTPDYAAPEQLRSSHTVDARADIYSLGATMYHLLSGRRPFEGDTVYNVIAKVICEQPPTFEELGMTVSPALEELIGKMMDKDPEKRPPSAEALRQMLFDVSRGKKIGNFGSASPRRSPGRGLIVSLVLAAALLLGFVIFNRAPGGRNNAEKAPGVSPAPAPAGTAQTAPTPAPAKTVPAAPAPAKTVPAAPTPAKTVPAAPAPASAGTASTAPAPAPAKTASSNFSGMSGSADMQANLPIEQRLLNVKKRLSELEKEYRAPDLVPEKVRQLTEKITFRRSQIALLSDRLRLREKQRAFRKKTFSAEKTAEVKKEIETLLSEKRDWGYNGRDIALVKKVVQKLKEGDVDANMQITDRRYSRCSGPLPQVALSGRLYPKEELLRTLCELGADTEMPPEVLSKGSYHVRDLAGYLINGIDGKPHGSILFHTLRIDSKNKAFFRELLRLGCGVNFKERATQQTPLHVAAIGDDAEAVKLLLLADADVNVRDAWGETPLFNAARSVDPQIYHLLLAAGADPNLKNNAGKTAADCFPDGRLRRAVAAKDAGETLRALQDKADPRLVLAGGDTLLAEACRIGFYDGVKLLAEHGADLNSRGRGRYSPLQYVYWSKSGNNKGEAFRIFKLLTELGAKTAINPPNYGGRITLTDHTLETLTWYRDLTRQMAYLEYMLESGKFQFNPRSVIFIFTRGNSAVLELLARKLPETDGDTARQILLAALRRKMPRKVIKPLLDRQRSPLPEEQLTEALKGNYADVIELFRGKISAAALSSLQQNADRRDSDKISSEDGKASSANSGSTRRRK